MMNMMKKWVTGATLASFLLAGSIVPATTEAAPPPQPRPKVHSVVKHRQPTPPRHVHRPPAPQHHHWRPAPPPPPPRHHRERNRDAARAAAAVAIIAAILGNM